MIQTLLQRTRAWPGRSIALWAAALLLTLGLFLAGGGTPQIDAGAVNVLTNGNFEAGFTHQEGCGAVGVGWRCFTNGGAANYGFYDDQWPPVVAEGGHSQLIEINTQDILDVHHDRYAGIQQTVRVAPWAQYTLQLQGMIRTTEMDGDPWRYRVQVGWTQGPHADWTQVTNWQDVGWDTYHPREAPGGFSSYATTLWTEADFVTVYVRVWKKWGVPNVELDVNLDAVSLTGPGPDAGAPSPSPTATATPTPGATATPTPTPAPSGDAGQVCGGANLADNGNFEAGFNATGLGHVGKSWGAFTNGGAANYGFYDDQWPPVVAEGGHSQLIEINTKGLAAADGDRYAGIYQRLSGLMPGATYQLTVRGLLRGVGGGEDPYRFVAQWGYTSGSDTDWQHVQNWQIMDLGPIGSRTEPGPMATYTVRFQAPDAQMVLFLRGWMKWGMTQAEMDLNLDSIRVEGCGQQAPPPPPPSPCVYVVQPGDALSAIAYAYRVNVYDLAAANHITNLNIIYVGQTLTIPGCGAADPPASPTPTPDPGPKTYTVQPGDSLSVIAARYGVDMYELARINGIYYVNYIYVGQVLVIP